MIWVLEDIYESPLSSNTKQVPVALFDFKMAI